MTDRTDNPATQNFPNIVGAELAPLIYADGILAVGLFSGVAEIEFSARSLAPIDPKTTNADARMVCRLRLNASGFASLKDAIQKIELMMAPSDAKPN